MKAINWSEIASKNLEVSLPEVEETEECPPEEDPDFPYGFSIFHELFRAADTESKMILLDEALAIGDEKELHFLKSLAEDPSPLIRKRAAQIQEALTSKLCPREEKKTTTEDLGIPHNDKLEQELTNDQETAINALFDLCFEPEIEVSAEESGSIPVAETKEQGKVDNNSSGSLMSRFSALTHKILEKIYG